MKRKIILWILMISGAFPVLAQKYYWVGFTDKKNTPYSISNPREYLSNRAIQRRERQYINIDSLDLPVNKNYMKGVTDLGVELVHASKWLNGATVKVAIDSFDYKVKKLPFVKEVQLTKKTGTKSAHNKFEDLSDANHVPIDTSHFGLSVSQISIMNAQHLYNLGFRGKGMQIAVLDAGFLNANQYFSFDSLWVNGQILGTHDFVNPAGDIFATHWHGMGVLSCMGGNVPGQLIGTATEAEYWLLRSEDAQTENLIEEDNWVVAAEFADSVGCDVINSSLGYTTFDYSEMNHQYADLNGNTTRVTRGANVAASRGMLVFASAGNEGNGNWHYIGAPSDGDLIVGVGAVTKDSLASTFTSYGPASDGDIKPNVSGMGTSVYMQTGVNLGYANGTSFSSPLVAGAATSLWSAFPSVTAIQVKQALELSSHLQLTPNERLGFGIPDFQKAYNYLMNLSSSKLKAEKNWWVFPNPVSEKLTLQRNSGLEGKTEISILAVDGKLLVRQTFSGQNIIVLEGLNSLPSGILILKISSAGETETFKISKI